MGTIIIPETSSTPIKSVSQATPNGLDGYFSNFSSIRLPRLLRIELHIEYSYFDFAPFLLIKLYLYTFKYILVVFAALSTTAAAVYTSSNQLRRFVCPIVTLSFLPLSNLCSSGKWKIQLHCDFNFTTLSTLVRRNQLQQLKCKSD